MEVSEGHSRLISSIDAYHRSSADDNSARQGLERATYMGSTGHMGNERLMMVGREEPSERQLPDCVGIHVKTRNGPVIILRCLARDTFFFAFNCVLESHFLAGVQIYIPWIGSQTVIKSTDPGHRAQRGVEQCRVNFRKEVLSNWHDSLKKDTCPI